MSIQHLSPRQDNALKVVIVGASPDWINRNAIMRRYVAEGFAEILGEGSVTECPLESGPAIVDQLRPDLVVCFGSCMPDVVDYGPLRDVCDRHGIGIAFWLHDDPYEFDAGHKAAEVADWLFSNDRWSSYHYKHPRTFHLPMAASPRAHLMPWKADKGTDVFFCGVAFSNRVQLIEDLSPALQKVRSHICGAEWPPQVKLATNQRLSNDQLAEGYADAWVTLNIGRNLNLANRRFQIDPSTPGPRTFEAALAGTVQMVFVESLEITDYFAPDKEIVLFDSPADFEARLKALLAQPAEMQRIAEAARARCLRDHTYARRAETLLSRCGYAMGSAAVNGA